MKGLTNSNRVKRSDDSITAQWSCMDKNGHGYIDVSQHSDAVTLLPQTNGEHVLTLTIAPDDYGR